MSNLRILLIDDENDIRRVADLSLSRLGKHNVSLAASGDEGLRQAGDLLPDLILLDVMMPVMDGIQVFDRLQERDETKNIPVIFMTARVQQAEKEKYIDMGAIGVIDKPFNPMELHQQVAQLMQAA